MSTVQATFSELIQRPTATVDRMRHARDQGIRLTRRGDEDLYLTTARRAEQAAEVVDYTAERFEQVLDPVDAVIDLIGNTRDDTASRSLAALRPGGLIVNGPTGSWPTMLDEAAAAGVRATGYRVRPDGATLAIVSRLIDSGDVRVFVDRVFDLEEVAAAHRVLEEGHTRGKLVLRVAEG